jgi:hypothetical protein
LQDLTDDLHDAESILREEPVKLLFVLEIQLAVGAGGVTATVILKK